MAEVKRLRDLGFERITLKTGAYSMRELAMAIKYSSIAKIDLLTIDGAPGGTGMSPWRMMEEWGIPTFYLQAMTYEICEKLKAKKMRVPDLAIAVVYGAAPAILGLVLGGQMESALSNSLSISGGSWLVFVDVRNHPLSAAMIAIAILMWVVPLVRHWRSRATR